MPKSEVKRLRSNSPVLLLKEIFKGRACIVGAEAGGRGRFFFSSHSNLVEGAVIPRIFPGNALLDWLHTFKAAARIEITALLARVQFEPTLRTLSLA